MASSEKRMLLECSVCLSVYTDPVTLTCGHSYCQVCIDKVLETQKTSGIYSCPQCRVKFRERPAPQKNIALCHIVQDFLIHNPEVPKQFLHDSPNNRRKKMCLVHNRILEFYCTQDAVCICVYCSAGEHRNHNVETLEDAMKKKKSQICSDLQNLMASKDDASKTLQCLQDHKKDVINNAAYETQQVAALFKDIGSHLKDLELKVLRDIAKQREEILLPTTNHIRQVGKDMQKTSRMIHNVRELQKVTDPITILRELAKGNFKPETFATLSAQLQIRGCLDFTLISASVYEGLSDLLTKAKNGSHLPEPADIYLDAATAGNQLQISGDKKTATNYRIFHGSYINYNNVTQIQDAWVLSSQSFCSGRHYWEVDVSKAHCWSVGVCYSSMGKQINRSWCKNAKAWLMECSFSDCIMKHGDTETKIKLPYSNDRRVQILVDYEAGRISFYYLSNPKSCLHTFTSTFTEPLHAALRVQISGSINICPMQSRPVGCSSSAIALGNHSQQAC